MAKSRIGPFSLEAPLSANRRAGQVYRGIHLEQRKLAALRVFPVPMGLTPESRKAYADQLEQLKGLRHPGIVRCYGGGFDTRNAYLAYELIDGESLDKTLERRGRLPWEAALETSQKITAVLQHAHHIGWIHGRLKPDKVLLASDGSVKLNDWRLEAISTMIHGGSPSLEQQLFAAPELFSGSEPDEKSDLYSVGAIMYTMLTGKPPFQANEAELPNVVMTAPAPDVSASVLDCPVWLNVIVAQLLSKDPSQRPFSATALQLAFKEAERRQSEGVGVLQHATAGFSPLKMNTDRAEAEKVLGIKKKKKRKQKETSIFEETWFLLVALAGVIGAIVWFMLPLSEEKLKQRAEQLLPPESEEWQDWNSARDAYMAQIVDRFPEGQHLEWAREQIEWVDARELERRLERENRMNRRSKWSDAERQYWQALEYEQFGDWMTALEKYRAVIGLYAENPDAVSVTVLANEGLQRIRKVARGGTNLQDFVAAKLAEANEAYDQARILEAREKWEWIISLYATNQDVAALVDEARQRLEDIKNRSR